MARQWGGHPMSGVSPAAGAAVAGRVSFSIAPLGGHAAWLSTGARGEPVTLEQRAAERPIRRFDVPQLDLGSQPLALDDGRVLLCQHDGSSHRLRLVGDRSQRTLAEVSAQGMRILAAPAGGPLAYALSVSPAGMSTIWRVTERAPELTALLELPAVLTNGVWLDREGTILAANRIADGRPSDVVALDLRRGTLAPLFSISPSSNERVLAGSAVTGLVAVSTDAHGRDRVGCGVLGVAPVRFPEQLRLSSDGCVLAVDPAGRRLLVGEQRGAVSELSLYDVERDRLARLPGDPGTVVGPASWTTRALQIAWSTPTAPNAIADVALDGGCWSLDGDEPGRWAPARLEQLQGPAGPIEAIVYGGAGWRRSRRLVIALHGGPLARWQFGFTGLFQSLAAAGIAVVAPNQRGSTGYGRAHMLAIRDAWGGPDLDDVRRIAHDLAAERRDLVDGELTVLGSSYGAYLALLAAQADPELWDGCVAMSPFLSGPRLHAEGPPVVRRLIERLGGRTQLDDALGPRDVLAGAGALRSRMLIMHGTQDARIPIGQARALRARLAELDLDVSYRELPGAGHDLATSRERDLVHELVTDFLHTSTRGGAAMR